MYVYIDYTHVDVYKITCYLLRKSTIFEWLLCKKTLKLEINKLMYVYIFICTFARIS